MTEQDNELPDEGPEYLALKNDELVWSSDDDSSGPYDPPVPKGATLYRKNGVAPEDLDTDNSRGLLLDRIKELEAKNKYLIEHLDLEREAKIRWHEAYEEQRSKSVDPALVKELIEATTEYLDGKAPNYHRLEDARDSVNESIGKQT